MVLRKSAFASLLTLAACTTPETPAPPRQIQPHQLRLGQVSPSEVATWKRAGTTARPDARYLQAAAFDETRKVMMVFGGMVQRYGQNDSASGELWEWNPATGVWTDRTPTTGSGPSARSGSAIVFDSIRNKLVLFGGRASTGYNFEDTWEWDPTTGIFADRTGAGSRPGGRSQHGMVFEKSTGKVLLFGGGRSDVSSYDGSGVTLSLGDTWEWDPTTGAWTERKPVSAPSARHDFGLVWDGVRSRAILFGGALIEQAGMGGLLKQDTWEWNPETAVWVDRTLEGVKPSPRFAHVMGFDAIRSKALVLGGFDISTGNLLGDVWEWDTATGAWSLRLKGTEESIPQGRVYASLVLDSARGVLELFGGRANSSSSGGGTIPGTGGSWGGPMPVFPDMGMGTASAELWELAPATVAFVNRTTPSGAFGPRNYPATAFCPTSSKTILFGGIDQYGVVKNDTWEWDGTTWNEEKTTIQPSGRASAAMAYDPTRKALILFGGQDSGHYASPFNQPLDDTWEWNCSTRAWSQLFPTSKPDPLASHGMVTDGVRGKVLLFGGMNGYREKPFPFSGGSTSVYKDPQRNEVWEWDGTALSWTNRTTTNTRAPNPRQYPVVTFDEKRQKLFLFDGPQFGLTPTAYWEWDPYSGGWSQLYDKDIEAWGNVFTVAYDSIRKRQVFFTDAVSPYSSSRIPVDTWELDPAGPTWFIRTIPSTPSSRYQPNMVFDSVRGVAVLIGGNINGMLTDETWEYKVTNLDNGAGCSPALATACASGNCVEGVCCGSASCTGPCQSCDVAGKEGTCVQATAGTEVPGSCSDGQACDGQGTCKTKNGQACTGTDSCASGQCVDGVCCNTACNGKCASCNQVGRIGTCTLYQVGTDPQGECMAGTGNCQSTCDGMGECAFPSWETSCGPCGFCDGAGTCYQNDPTCSGTGGYPGAGGYPGVGGKPATGGYTGTAGSPANGGYTGTAGSPGLGGAFSTGGTTWIGGNTMGGAGGRPVTGGSTTGGIPKGGSTQAGGSPSGGSPYTGGTPRSGGTMATGGAGGGPRTGGSMPTDGSVRDGKGGGDGGVEKPGTDALNPGKLGNSGCSCQVGGASSGAVGPGLPLVLFGIGLVIQGMRRKRRR